jgi:hypothetical protein
MPIDQITSASIENASIAQVDLATGVAGTGPAFSAYNSSNQNVTSNTWTKMIMNTEVFDTNNCYDPTTNYRFTPNVAGYYLIVGGQASAAAGGFAGGIVSIYKNGSGIRYSTKLGGTNNTDWSQVTGILYMNGSTDYVELFINVIGTSPYYFTNLSLTFFEASMVRAA